MASFPTRNITDDIITRAQREGFLVGPAILGSSTAFAARTNIGSLIPVGFSEAFVCTDVVIGVDKPVGVQVAMGAEDQTGLLTGDQIRVFLNARSIVIPMYGRIFSPRQAWGVYLENGDGTSTVNYSFCANGFRITDDLNFNAAKTILWVGDSIPRGSGITGNNTVQSYDRYTFQTRDLIRSLGYDCRLVVKAIGGTTTTQGERIKRQGQFDISGADLIFYNYGANDGAQSVSSSIYNANINSFITWAKWKYPTAKIVLLGPPPNGTPATETNLVGIRSSMSSIASGDGSGRVFYCNLGTAFLATDSTQYYDGVHPNFTGENNMYNNCLAPFINTNHLALLGV